ncbi:LacI family DNA-binding transcriptional regulator [Rhodospira trueperi]|uniref:DNA-binding transcriptional regulator, LacI/PurR family n=1 Tax=Rhodospira trueperi TaxID=69960 RepID=A0A1G7AQL3_9PROT|nr:LacI family DNA-binding transcriptional regulator [Rhodospira trueperi]SDE16206.1 DNA-binding transcriptional regulator, LacI/PurR family [Rhodospira trueperi]
MGATIRDVAQAAGVSVATVSRLVNGTGRVRDDTARRVQTAIDRLGFRPNAIGRNLSTARTRTLGVVIPSLSNPVFADAVAGINAEAKAQGYTLMFMATDYVRTDEQALVGTLLAYQVDGLILTVADAADSPVLDALDRDDVPYVLIYNQPTARNRPTVTVDNVTAGREVADFFADLGHERLAMVSGTLTASDRARARRDGFVAGAEARGLAAPRVLEVDFVDLDADAAVAPLFADRTGAPTALFCSNDLLAISVIGALGRLGLGVPADVSVIGFDGIAVGAQLHPTLATVAQPSREMGRVATTRLLARLAGETAAPATVLPHTLRPGESAGPAAKPCPADLQVPFHHNGRSPS